MDIAQLLIDHKATVDARSKNSTTPLHVAAKFGQMNIVDLLIIHGADVNATDVNNLTPLHVAAEYGALDIVKLLMSERVDVNAENINKLTPLHFASQNGNVHVVEFLIENGAHVHAKDDKEWTPLHFAAKNGRTEVIIILIWKGAQIDAINLKGNTPLSLATKNVARVTLQLQSDKYCSRIGKKDKGWLDSILEGLVAIRIPSLIAIGFIFLIIVVIILIYFLRERKRSRHFKNLLQGNPKCLDLDRALNEQAHLLPYKKEFEFPRKRLEVGKRLGAGAFGEVHEGIAIKILNHEQETKVAIKKVNDVSNVEDINILISELKVMMHLGRHFNLVNLLGAVTENIEQSGLMIIVELCEFGNIEILLRNNRKYFIDQINHENDTIDATIFAKDQGDQEGQRSSTESLENDGYKTLTKPHPITTSDLVCWAFQVARGMHYLISRNVLHRDLATRNILLCANNVVKICDFGLAKSLHNKAYYRKNGGERVPYRWLAPESLIDQKYSVHSDVWSFGIVLWELFSLGLMPYSELDDSFNNLANFLQRGNRLSKPEYATQSIYDIMMSCWNADPNARPLFDSLAMTFSDLMKPDDLEKFIDLNKSFMEKNAEKYKSEENDCLASVKLDENPENDENTTQSCVVDVLSPENPNGNAECVVEIPLKTIV